MKRTRRFIADAMLGKLAKWLRILGLDVAYEKAIEDQALISRARLEKREILTRDRRLVQRRWGSSIRFIVIQDDHVSGQLRQVARELGLSIGRNLLTRCVECNEPLTAFPREQAAFRVPAYVHQTRKRFMQCPACRRIYWKGTHHRRILKRLKTFFPKTGTGRLPMGIKK